MAKGILEMGQTNNTGGNNEEREQVVRYMKEGETIIATVGSLQEFYRTQIVGVYDNVNKESVISPSVVHVHGEDKVETLYDKVLKELWLDYDKEKGSKDPENKKVLNKVNSIKRQDYVYFGLIDVETGKPVILPMGFNFEEGRKNKAGNNFYGALTKLEKQIKNFPLEITKGSMGAWTILPYMDDLTEEQKSNFEKGKKTEIADEVYQGAFFKANEERQANDIRNFGAKFGFDPTRVGVEPVEKKEEGQQAEGEQQTEEGNYGF